MMSTKIKFFLYRLSLLLLLIGIILPAGSALAQEQRSGGGVILPDYYPARFSGHGCIGRIAGDEVVIDDRLYRLTSNTTFHTLQSEYASRSRFREGMRVGFIKSGISEIESLWYIKQCR